MGLARALPSAVSRFGATDVRVERQARRSLQISIKKDWILIKAPLGASDADIADFVARHVGWIEHQLARQSPKRSAEGVELLGEMWRFAPPPPGEGSRSPRLLASSKTIICDPPASDSDWSKIYRRAALDLLPPLLKQISARVGLSPPPLSVKTLSRAWGVCHSSGRVELHWGLVKLSLELASYVICHELAHLTHLNHSQAFWALCDRYCPGSRRLDRAIKSAAPPAD